MAYFTYNGLDGTLRSKVRVNDIRENSQTTSIVYMLFLQMSQNTRVYNALGSELVTPQLSQSSQLKCLIYLLDIHASLGHA